MQCKDCGDRMEGDGYCQVIRCPNKPEDTDIREPDAQAFHCNGDQECGDGETSSPTEPSRVPDYWKESSPDIKTIKKGDMRVINGVLMTCTDPEIGRWQGSAPQPAELCAALKHTEFLLAQVRKENDHLKHLLNPDNISGRTSFKPTHVDDWLDNECARTDSERYARFVINYFRMPALEQFDFAKWMEPFKLFCTYKGKRYRVTGASRLGDIWLAANPEQTTGYDLRVSVRDCDQWADSPTEGAE